MAGHTFVDQCWALDEFDNFMLVFCFGGSWLGGMVIYL